MTMKSQFSKFSLAIITGLLALGFLSGCLDTKPVEEKKPNVLLIFTDDQIYSSIHALGNSEIKTPNMDRLVAEGTTFTHAYNMGGWNGAICTASRSMMITGRTLWHANEFRKNWKTGEGIDKTWGQLMKVAGYDTYMTGKWHVDVEAKQVFDTAIHVRKGMPEDYRSMKGKKRLGYNRPQSPQDSSWSPTDPKFGGYWEGGKHWSEIVRDDALGFLDKSAGREDPFFMYIAFNAPHDPRQAPQEYQDLYNVDELSLPTSYQPDYPERALMGNPRSLRDEALAPFPRTEYAIKTHKKEYYALISHLDTQIGEILDELEASGQKENTYIFFTSDHGLAVGRHGLIGKQSMYDHSIRPPLIVIGPDIPKGERIDADVYLQDVMASALQVAQVPKPDYVEFNSLLPLAKKEQVISNYPSIYGAYMNAQRMVRKDGYKLIVYPKAKKLLLFDLKNDAEEIDNLASNPAYADKVKELIKELERQQAHYDDPLDLSEFLFQQITRN